MSIFKKSKEQKKETIEVLAFVNTMNELRGKVKELQEQNTKLLQEKNNEKKAKEELIEMIKKIKMVVGEK